MQEICEWIAENPLYLLLAIGTIFNLFWLGRFRAQLQISRTTVIILSVLHTIFGVMSVWLFAKIEIIAGMSDGGRFSLFGGVFFMPIVYLTIAKLIRKQPEKVFDIFTICILFTLMCARIGCIISGCCQGRIIPGLDIRYPTREVEVCFYIITIIILGKKVCKGEKKGKIYPIYMISYGIFRFIEEFFRDKTNATIVHPSHIWALLCLVIGISFYLEMKVTDNKEKKIRGRRKEKHD